MKPQQNNKITEAKDQIMKIEKVPTIQWDYQTLADTMRAMLSFDWENKEVSHFKLGMPN